MKDYEEVAWILGHLEGLSVGVTRSESPEAERDHQRFLEGYKQALRDLQDYVMGHVKN